MANLKEIRNRIDSVQSTEQITTAMRMVSASKLRKAQLGFSSIQPYSDALANIARELFAVLNQDANPIDSNIDFTFQEKQPEKVLLFVFTSNRGLCGPFNMNAVKYVSELIKTTYQQQWSEGRLHIMAAGRRGGEILEKQGFPIISTYHDLLNNINYKDISSLSQSLFQCYRNGTYQKIILIYNKFKTVLTQELTEWQFLPTLPPKNWEENHKEPIDFIFEPDKQSVLKSLYPKILSTQLYRVFLESIASEEGARMTAMQQASDNAAILLKELKVTYNKARQAAITNELLEIMAGAEALNNQ